MKVVIEGPAGNDKYKGKKRLPKFVNAVLLTIIGALAATIFAAIISFDNPIKESQAAAVHNHTESVIDYDVETAP